MDLIRDFFRKHIKRLAITLDKISSSRLSAGHITVTSLAGHIPIAWLIIVDQLFWAAIALFIFGMLDVLDGELARYQKKASVQGMVLDATTDRLKETLLFSAAAYWIGTTDNSNWTWLVVLALGTSLSSNFLKAKAEAAVALKNPKIDHHRLNRMFSEGLVEFDARMIIFGAGLLFNQLFFAIIVLAAVSSYSAIERFSIIRRL